MGRIRRWFWHLVTGMVQGCLILAILAAVVSVAGALIATHKLPQGIALAYVITIVIISGVLGALATLVWRLTHIGELVKVAEHVNQRLQQNETSK